MENKEMRVLVTGANGLLGSYIVRELAKKGYTIRVIVREGSNLKALEGFDVEIVKGYITQKEEVMNAVKGCNFLIHAAARTTQKPSWIEPYIKPNIDSTRYLIDACRKYDVERFVFVSSANCFGNGPLTDPGNEERPFKPWLKNSGYAYSKLLAQQMVLKEVNDSGLNAVVVNPTFIIGGIASAGINSEIFSYINNKRVVFYPPGGKNFVDAGAAAYGVISAMETGEQGECYLLAGENISYSEFFRTVAGITGQRTLLLPVPGFILRIAGLWGDFIEKIFKIPMQLTRVNARMLCNDNFYTSVKAQRELKMPYIHLKESLKKLQGIKQER